MAKKDKDKKEEIPEEEAPQEFVRLPAPPTIEAEEPHSLPWLITFTDVMALMLTFFVLLYSMSVPSQDDWEEMSSALNRQFKKDFSAEWYEGPQDSVSIDKLDFTEAQNLGYLSSVISKLVDEDENLKNVVLIPQKDHLVVSLPQEILFESGEATVAPKGKQALFTLGGILSRIRNRIEVVGHADPRPVPAGKGFGSNWELSLARATNVSLILKNVGYSRPVTVRGLSSARFDELPDTISQEKRLDYARRVDILIMKDDGSEREMSGFDILY